MNTIIGVFGHKGVGKTTISNLIRYLIISNETKDYVDNPFLNLDKVATFRKDYTNWSIESKKQYMINLIASILNDTPDNIKRYIDDNKLIDNSIVSNFKLSAFTYRGFEKSLDRKIIKPNFSNTFIIKTIIDKAIREGKNIIIDGINYKNEANLIKKYNGYIIKVEKSVTFEGEFYKEDYDMNNYSEDKIDFIVDNDKNIADTLDDLYSFLKLKNICL